jgi:boron transporter
MVPRFGLAAVGFPIIVTLLIPWRTIYGPRFFSPRELSILDAPTADSSAVLVSVGAEIERVTGEGLDVAPDTGIEGTAMRDAESSDEKGLKYRRAAHIWDEEG